MRKIFNFQFSIFKRYLKVWLKLTGYSFMTTLTSRFSFTLFLFGKILRFILFFVFLLLLLSRTKVLVGYNLYQAAFFVLTYNLIDTGVQLFFREVYRFRPLVVSGNFDLVLVKPFSPLFRSLLGGADVIDLFMAVPFLSGAIYLMTKLDQFSLIGLIFYILLVFNAFIIATAFHIAVLALGVLTTEIDNTIMLYRDVTRMGTVPIDIYKEPLRGFLTFVIPVGIMMTFPPKALMGLLSWWGIAISFIIGGFLFYLSLKFWQYALRRYSSASS
ncbi:ABC-2 family transporter protein [Candidatus Gottesmanbacteria bacterium]|nr:ABC-2 family transporter protein [Candidatus Gottesmanbacteria bacterium]